MLRKLVAPLAWMLIGASLVLTWSVVASGSSDLDDNSTVMPSQVITIDSAVRGSSAPATLVVSFPSEPVFARTSGALTSLSQDLPATAPAGGVVWGSVDGRPRLLAASDTPFAFHRALSKGSKGPDVGFLQSFLTARGFYSGSIDERFGTGLQTALLDYRESIDALTGDKVLQVGDLVFASPAAELAAESLTVGMNVDPQTAIAIAQTTTPFLELRFLPRAADLIVIGAKIEGPDFNGVVTTIDNQPLLVDTSYLLTGTVDGQAARLFVGGETLEVTVSNEATERLWIPIGSVAVDGQGRSFAVTPEGDRVLLDLEDEVGGFAAIGAGTVEGEEFLLPNPDLFNG